VEAGKLDEAEEIIDVMFPSGDKAAEVPGGKMVSRKLPARTYSTSWHSAGEALSTDKARGRLLSAAIAMVFVPLPRRVGPTAKPPFGAGAGGIHEPLFQI